MIVKRKFEFSQYYLVHVQRLMAQNLRKWESSETVTPNPFTDYRLDVRFEHPKSGKSYLVPGYYAADGGAANSGADSGSVWRVHFSPDELGEWQYAASFRTGPKVAVSGDSGAGEPTAFDGTVGRFEVVASDKTGRDNRARGRLQYIGGALPAFRRER